MAITLTQVERFKKKFKNLEFKVLEETEGKADVFSITWQKFGLPGKVSEGMIEVNAMWDERKSRPKNYYIAHNFDRDNGISVSIMVSEEWLDGNSASKKREEWERTA